MYQPTNLAYRSNKEFIPYIGKRKVVNKEWCNGGHWKIRNKPCEVCLDKKK